MSTYEEAREALDRMELSYRKLVSRGLVAGSFGFLDEALALQGKSRLSYAIEHPLDFWLWIKIGFLCHMENRRMLKRAIRLRKMLEWRFDNGLAFRRPIFYPDDPDLVP